MHKETIEHALLLCSWTSLVWFGSQLSCTPNLFNITRADLWLQHLMENMKGNSQEIDYNLSFVANILRMIWKDRNNFTFRAFQPNPVSVINKATTITNEFFDSLAINKSSSQGLSVPKLKSLWRPPPKDWVKCNVDAAFCNSRRIAAIAAVIKDSTGKLIAGKAQKIPCSSSRLAEALAMREGLLLANSCCCEKILVESDCLEVVEACRNRIACSELAMEVEDVNRMKSWFSHCGLLWIRREANQVAHQVARFQMEGNLNRDWVIRYPSIIADLLKMDSPK